MPQVTIKGHVKYIKVKGESYDICASQLNAENVSIPTQPTQVVILQAVKSSDGQNTVSEWRELNLGLTGVQGELPDGSSLNTRMGVLKIPFRGGLMLDEMMATDEAVPLKINGMPLTPYSNPPESNDGLLRFCICTQNEYDHTKHAANVLYIITGK